MVGTAVSCGHVGTFRCRGSAGDRVDRTRRRDQAPSRRRAQAAGPQCGRRRWRAALRAPARPTRPGRCRRHRWPTAEPRQERSPPRRPAARRRPPARPPRSAPPAPADVAHRDRLGGVDRDDQRQSTHRDPGGGEGRADPEPADDTAGRNRPDAEPLLDQPHGALTGGDQPPDQRGRQHSGQRHVAGPARRRPQRLVGRTAAEVGLTHNATVAGWTVTSSVRTSSICSDASSAGSRTRSVKSWTARCASYRRR